MTDPITIGDRLKALRTEFGKARGARATQAEVADAVGIARSTLTAYEKGHDKPGRDTLIALADYYGVSMDAILSNSPTIAPIHTTQIEVRGDVQAGVWREAIEWPQADWYAITVPLDVAFAGLHRYGLLVKGDSMDKVFPDGSIAVVINLVDLGRMPKTGEIAVVVQRSKTSNEFEATVKAVQVLDSGEIILWPQSTNPDFATPIRIKPGECDHDAGMPDVFIQALVVASYRPKPTVIF